jgi:hypothetical protein
MNDPKAPQFLADLVHDLRDRRLLPLIAVIAIAIVAVPFALAQSHSSQTASTARVTAPSIASVSSSSRLVVTSDNPGLRDYRKRLSGLSPRDPFQQPLGAGGSSAAGASPATTVVPTTSGGATGRSTGTGSSGSPTSSSTSSTTTNTSNTSGQGTGGTTGQLHYFTFRIDAAVGKEGDLTVRHGIDYMTLLPDKAFPVAMYAGADLSAGRALFLVSGNVAKVTGDGRCLMQLSGGGCQLVGLKVGEKADFLIPNDKFGTTYTTYVIRLLQVHLHQTTPPSTGRFRATSPTG